MLTGSFSPCFQRPFKDCSANKPMSSISYPRAATIHKVLWFTICLLQGSLTSKASNIHTHTHTSATIQMKRCISSRHSSISFQAIHGTGHVGDDKVAKINSSLWNYVCTLLFLFVKDIIDSSAPNIGRAIDINIYVTV